MTPSPRLATPDDAGRLAELHAIAIHEGFLVTLGPAFLQRLYARVARSPRAFALVVDGDDDDVCGFIAVADDIGAFYREFLLHDGAVASVAALPRLARAPWRVFETLWYGAGAGNAGPATEILAVAVAASAQGRGVGRVLADAAVAEIQRRGLASARVVTATGNYAAIRTYESAGFRREGQATVHRGITQEVLVWP